jgi:hypothetical protein
LLCSLFSPHALLANRDKGLKSTEAEGFICQKKNHFQVSVVVTVPTLADTVETSTGYTEPIVGYLVDLHGVKSENHSHIVKLEQSSYGARFSTGICTRG